MTALRTLTPRGKDAWIRVSRQNPCPVCGKADNCSVSTDGGAVWCGRVDVGAERQNAGGQWLHVLDDRRGLLPKMGTVVPKRKQSAKDFAAIARQCHEYGKHFLAKLEAELGPSVDSWGRLLTGRQGELWTHPEFDPRSTPIGVTTRSATGDKRQIAGGRRGLIFARDWLREPGTILSPEGASGTAALLTLGFPAVGRFNNAGGADLLADLFMQHEDDVRERGLVLIADNDPKPNGTCPGWQGAERVALALADFLRVSVGVSFPPEGLKDSRDWFVKHKGTASIDTLRQRFADGLKPKWFHPPVLVEKRPEPQPTITLDDAREQMLAARLEVLSMPGVYLDRTECGAGKTYADLQASSRAASRDTRILFILPTHENCAEVETEASDMGMQAASFPKRITTPNEDKGETQTCWNADADACEAIGLPVVAAVCTSCTEKGQCMTSGYLAGLVRAGEATVALATHCRGRVQGPVDLANGRGYIAAHEDSRELLRPTDEADAECLESARTFLDAATNDPATLNSGWFNGTTNDAGETEAEDDEE